MLALSHFRAALRKMNVISIDLPLGQNISMIVLPSFQISRQRRQKWMYSPNGSHQGREHFFKCLYTIQSPFTFRNSVSHRIPYTSFTQTGLVARYNTLC